MREGDVFSFVVLWMVKVQCREKNVLIWKNVCFVLGDEMENMDGYVVLRECVGPMMSYGEIDSIINFPGEYDMKWVAVKAWADERDLLNYIVELENSFVVIVQSKSFLDEGGMPDEIAMWIFADEQLVRHREWLEYEGNYIDLSSEDCGVQTMERGREVVFEWEWE